MTFHNQDRDIHTSYHSNSNYHDYHQHHDEIEYEALNHCELHISYHNQDEYTETPISKTLVQTHLRIPEYGSSNAVSDVDYHKMLYRNSENHTHNLFVVNYHEYEDEH